MKINLKQESVMVISNIQLGFIDELGKTIIEGVAMNDQGFRRQRSVEPAAQESPCGQKEFVGDTFEFG